ncbi:hypothetical protein [Pseudidiomarina sp. YC-516-91]|uniref:hypothetical protein n=1 Tax=Pseudidiomarina salilacus TaxID=3384452 RepID=UPI0039850F81
MKKLLSMSLGLLMTLLFALGPLSSKAQDLGHFIEGPFISAWSLALEPAPLPQFDDVARFRIEVEYDTSIPMTNSDFNEFLSLAEYSGNIRVVRIMLFDASGNPIDTGLITPFDSSTANSPTSYHRSFQIRGSTEQMLSDELIVDARSLVNEQMLATIIEVDAVSSALHESFSPFPRLFTTELVSPARVDITHATLFDGLRIQGTADVIGTYTLQADADADGVLDDVDLCGTSNLAETVIFRDWYDSGVVNYVDGDGCSIMDRYAACSVETETRNLFSRFRPLYNGPSYCEKQVSYALYDEQIITSIEARLLRDALYMSYRGDDR